MNISAKGTPGNTMNPALSQDFFFLANRNSSKNIQLFVFDKKSYQVLLCSRGWCYKVRLALVENGGINVYRSQF